MAGKVGTLGRVYQSGDWFTFCEGVQLEHSNAASDCTSRDTRVRIQGSWKGKIPIYRTRDGHTMSHGPHTRANQNLNLYKVA